MAAYLKEKRDVGFFTSMSGLMNSCSVLDLDAFERIIKAEGLGVNSEPSPTETNDENAANTCKLFRFLQLLCEGHNLGMFLLDTSLVLSVSLYLRFFSRISELSSNSARQYGDCQPDHLHR
jgi:hypothetical protein